MLSSARTPLLEVRDRINLATLKALTALSGEGSTGLELVDAQILFLSERPTAFALRTPFWSALHRSARSRVSGFRSSGQDALGSLQERVACLKKCDTGSTGF